MITKSIAKYCLSFCQVVMVGGIGIAPTSNTALAQNVRSNAGHDIVVTARRPHRSATPPITIDKVVNIIGLEGAKENGSGRLAIDDHDIVFLTDRTTSTIPVSAITTMALDHTSKPLLRGIAGTLAGFAPNGGGQVYGAIRPGAEMLTLVYTDRDRARHAAVLLLPKSSKERVTQAFARVGISLDDPAQSDERAISPPPANGHRAPSRSAFDAGRPAVTVMLPRSNGISMPLAFNASAYEQLVLQTAKSGLFGAVWREGDRRADPAALTMTVEIMDFRKGNAGVRGAIPVVGMIAGKTLITANVRLADASGTLLLDKEVEGSKRMMGESIAATKSLAQRVTGAIAKTPGFVKGPPAASRYMADEVAAR